MGLSDSDDDKFVCGICLIFLKKLAAVQAK